MLSAAVPGSEFDAVVDLLAMLVFDARSGVLIAALLLAAWCDARFGRIPNELVFSGIAIALVQNAVAPLHGGGLLWSLAGLGVGLALLLPFYLLRAMGAGDVKLMAMAGAFLGFPDALYAGLASFVAGGLLSLILLAKNGGLRTGLVNLLALARGRLDGLRLGAGAASAGTLPYGVAIAAGTIGYLVARQLGFID